MNTQRWRTTYRAVLGDVQDAKPLALVPQPNSPVGSDKVLEVEAGFNAPGCGRRLVARA